MRNILKSTLFVIALGAMATPVMAVDAPAAATVAKAAFSTTDTDIGTLIDTPATRTVLDKFLPGLSTNDQISMARSMTLRAIQPMAGDKISVDALDKMDAELAKLPAAK
jgi:hypothetical protein